MKVKEILDIANKGYPERYLSQWYDDEGKFVDNIACDMLAEFVVRELIETFDDVDDADDIAQLLEAMRVIRAARDELDNVWSALHVEFHKAARIAILGGMILTVNKMVGQLKEMELYMLGAEAVTFRDNLEAQLIKEAAPD